ncbi:dienelactone hydrolase family protein [Talaromyces proteolyticus]|uniref:Dienelactone hydrolase family protein n=1 Tax=Talaromyces proteolyticus TaxID=1131652 RepID=A0AAD4Q2G7_9EURO|nr:dienelactone hydrolase family protein [Talaromyces proteolyticus]KAH8700313.1 dienelactone hydrolase family protein [Talaromyces proteolyticus]
MSSVSDACCATPAVSNVYKQLGEYIQIGGEKTYMYTPAPDTKTGIVFLYDIFGYTAQTIKGADLLAQRTDSVVLMPDVFHGMPMELDAVPPKTEEQKITLQQFLKGPANPVLVAEKIWDFVDFAEPQFPDVESWGVVGLCWGGKVATLLSGPRTPFKYSAQAHPAMLDANDAKEIIIPHLLLASGDEDPSTVKSFAQNMNSSPNMVKSQSQIVSVPTMFHGYMGARVNLDNKQNAEEYEKG